MKKEFEKTIKSGKWVMEHRRYRNDFGFLVDAFEMVYNKKDGRKVHMPFMPYQPVTNYSADSSIPDAVVDFTKKDYDEMFVDMVEKFGSKVREPNEKEECVGVCPNVCWVHGGQFEFCISEGCSCRRRKQASESNYPPRPPKMTDFSKLSQDDIQNI